MNNSRRKDIRRAIDILRDIQDRYEGLQQSDQGQRTEANADALDNIQSDLDNVEFENLIDQLEGAME